MFFTFSTILSTRDYRPNSTGLVAVQARVCSLRASVVPQYWQLLPVCVKLVILSSVTYRSGFAAAAEFQGRGRDGFTKQTPDKTSSLGCPTGQGRTADSGGTAL